MKDGWLLRYIKDGRNSVYLGQGEINKLVCEDWFLQAPLYYYVNQL